MTYSDKSKRRDYLFEKFVNLCRCAASALGVSEGEFWVWYGNLFILQHNTRK